LYFSDWSAGEVLGVDLAGDTDVVARVKSLPLYTTWLPDGRLVIDAYRVIAENLTPQSGANSDIRHPQVLWAIASAAYVSASMSA
jgi:hypothetical protein